MFLDKYLIVKRDSASIDKETRQQQQRTIDYKKKRVFSINIIIIILLYFIIFIAMFEGPSNAFYTTYFYIRFI